MGAKGLDFKHKEVINITDGKRLRICTGCYSRLRNWNNNLYDGALIENKYMNFILEREYEKKSYITKNNQNRTGYVLKEKFKYNVICKVEL